MKSQKANSNSKKPKKVNIYDAELTFEELVEYAMESDYIRKPVSWALYQTWKWAEANEKERKNDKRIRRNVDV